jgi:hypothetical protein
VRREEIDRQIERPNDDVLYKWEGEI